MKGTHTVFTVVLCLVITGSVAAEGLPVKVEVLGGRKLKTSAALIQGKQSGVLVAVGSLKTRS